MRKGLRGVEKHAVARAGERALCAKRGPSRVRRGLPPAASCALCVLRFRILPLRKGAFCMEYTVPRRGAAVVSAWLAGLGALLVWLFWRDDFAFALPVLVFWTAVCFGIVSPRLSSYVLRVGGHHLSLRRGLLFPVTRRVPLRFVTGCHMVQSPLQRMTGTCVFLLYSSGVTTVVPGMRRADAEALAAMLTYGGKIL